ncbi:hypothetical protein [Zavarzinia sp. CC-PAN008]
MHRVDLTGLSAVEVDRQALRLKAQINEEEFYTQHVVPLAFED